MHRILLALCIAAHGASLSAEWPQWRGPARNGLTASSGYPAEWSETENVLWRAPLPGVGNSSPIVVGDLVVVTASSGPDHQVLHVLAFARSSGEPAWTVNLFATPAPAPYAMFPPERGHAAPTAVTDGRAVVALFGTGDVVALDLAGHPLWMRSLAADYGPLRNDYGIATSPLIAGELILVQIDHADDSYLAALDLATGATRWRTPRRAADNWSSPVIVERNGTQQVVCAGTGELVGYDLATGSEEWVVSGLERLCAPTPVVTAKGLFVVSGPAGATLALEVTDEASPRVAWASRRDGPFIASPVVVGDLYLMVNDQAIVTCRDVHTGEDLWRARLGIERPRASLVSDGEQVYCTGLEGTTVVFRAARSFEEIARNELSEAVAASAAMAGGRFYFRTETALVCIGH